MKAENTGLSSFFLYLFPSQAGGAAADSAFMCVLQEIQSLLINWKGPDLTTYGELVLEGSFHVLRAKNTRTLFLFERMLLITKKRGEHYVYKIHISVWLFLSLDTYYIYIYI